MSRRLISALILIKLCLGYLDPGSSSFILQILVAGALGLLLSAKLFWQRIIQLFRRAPKMTDESTPPDDHA
jgi:hypothetical protein